MYTQHIEERRKIKKNARRLSSEYKFITAKEMIYLCGYSFHSLTFPMGYIRIFRIFSQNPNNWKHLFFIEFWIDRAYSATMIDLCTNQTIQPIGNSLLNFNQRIARDGFVEWNVLVASESEVRANASRPQTILTSNHRCYLHTQKSDPDLRKWLFINQTVSLTHTQWIIFEILYPRKFMFSTAIHLLNTLFMRDTS